MQKTYLVYGAIEGGIGEAVTRRILSEGHKVIGTYDPSKSAKVHSFNDDNLKLHRVDHNSRKSLMAFASKIRKKSVDGVVYVQMMFEMENPTNFDHDLWEKMIFANLSAPNICVHSLKTKIRKGGSIAIVTSTEGFTGSFGASAYAATKAAIHNLVKTHCNNLGPQNIRVNAIAPGWIGGVMDTDDVFNMSREITPLSRLGSPDEVAAVANFLMSAEASFVNGTTIVVDGGYSNVDAISKFEFEAETADKD